MKKTAIIFGAGATGSEVYEKVKNDYDVLYYVDNDDRKIGTKKSGIDVKNPAVLYNDSFDKIIIATLTGSDEIFKQISGGGVSVDKIVTNYCNKTISARIKFLSNFAKIVYDKNIKGAVAEVGVYRGEFAKYINSNFTDRKLYLYDTFTGFDARDLKFELENKLSKERVGHFHNTSCSLVLEKMVKPENCLIKQGYFPETFTEKKEKFCFVSLDTDLYKPILDGLNVFYPLMVSGGVILVDDYFRKEYLGVKQAVDEWSKNNNVSIIPIADDNSVAIIKN